jgi:7-keto-8-aminopelargonate synthetase-like enzyme
MDADIVDLKEVVRLCKKYNAVLFLDDCHGVGVIGKTG